MNEKAQFQLEAGGGFLLHPVVPGRRLQRGRGGHCAGHRRDGQCVRSRPPGKCDKIRHTANQLFTLSEQTEKLVGGLTDEVTVYWIVRSGREEKYLESLLSRYQSLSDKIRVVKKEIGRAHV